MTAFNKAAIVKTNLRVITRKHEFISPLGPDREINSDDSVIWQQNLGTISGDSVNTVTPGKRLPKMVAWVPKKYPLKVPIEPVLQQPKLPKLKPRREGQSDSSWNFAVQKFRNLRTKVLIARARNDLRYLDRYKKYEKRLANYKKYLELLKNGNLRYVKLKTRYSEWHPFNSLRNITYFSGSQINRYPPWLPTEYRNGALRNSGRYASRGVGTDFVMTVGNNVVPAGTLVVPSTTNTDCIRSLLAAETRAKKQYFDNLAKQEVHVGNIIAERHQSLKMLKDLLERVSNLLVKRDKLSLAALIGGKTKGDITKKLSNDFLMFQFGLRPLMSDIFGTLEILASKSYDVESYYTVRSQGKHTTTYKSGTKVITVKTKCRFVVDYNVDNKVLATLHSIGLVNPLEIAWEVLPWSFVVDWFLPIGAWVHALETNTGLTFKRGTKSTTITSEYSQPYRKITNNLPGYPAGYGNSEMIGRSVAVAEKKVRVLLTQPPDLMFPSMKNPFSAYHLAEALALIRQRFR